MSIYLRRLGVFHTLPPLCVLESTTLTGYVINTNRLRPTTLYGDKAFDKGCLHNKMRILCDTVMELNIDVLHITETHDYMKKSPPPLTPGAATPPQVGSSHKGQPPSHHLRSRMHQVTLMCHKCK